MTAPTLVLDLDGTLADTMHDLIPVLNRTTATEGLPAIEMSDVGHIVGHGARAMIERSFQFHNQPYDEALLSRLFDLFIADYSENTCTHTPVFDGVHASLERFADNGWLLAVCTNKVEAMALKVLEGLDLSRFMSSVTGGDTFDVRKPDAFHLQETVRLAGGDPSNAIMVGDSITDISAARNASIPVVAVDFGYSDKPVRDYNPDCTISHFDDLFAAANSLLASTKASG